MVLVYNEEESIEETVLRLLSLRDVLSSELETELLFTDDGSKDKSLALLKSRKRNLPFRCESVSLHSDMNSSRFESMLNFYSRLVVNCISQSIELASVASYNPKQLNYLTCK